MIKLNKQIASLESILEKIEEKIDKLNDKISIIEEAAEDRDITESENNRILEYMDQIEELGEEADAIGNALDYLRDYEE